MNTSHDFDDWDILTLALVKAVAGNTSANIQRVTLDRRDSQWVLRFLLFKESASDRDDISDISTEFYSYGENYGVMKSLSDIGADEILADVEVAPPPYSPRARVVLMIKKNA